MFTQKFIKIQVQETGLFSLFQDLNLGNASANRKWHLTISLATSCQYQCVCKILSKYSKRFKSYRHFSRTGRGQNLHKQVGDKIKFQSAIIIFFRIWNSAKPRPMKNVISQSLGRGLVNINVYAKVYQNIPLSSRDRAIFTFSEFGARQRLDQ